MTTYDSSWDDGNDELWDEMHKKWKKRNWSHWLKQNLSFPFKVERVEDMDVNPFAPVDENNPFREGETMNVIGFHFEDEMRGIIAIVKKGNKKGYVPLSDVQVLLKESENFWPVREYVVWIANS